MLAFWRNHKGTASAISGTLAALFGLTLFALVYDVAFVYVRRDVLKQALDYANMAVYRAVDVDALAHGQIRIDPDAGYDAFLSHLQRNLKLNDDLSPAEGSLVAGKVEVTAFEIYNPEALPTTDPTGHPVTNVAVYSEIMAPVRPFFSWLFPNVTLRVAILTDAPAGVVR